MGEREWRRGRRKPPGPPPGLDPNDTGKALEPPAAEVLARLDEQLDGATPPDGAPVEPERRTGEGLEGRWRARSTQTATARGGRTAPTPAFHDTKPRFVPPDESTDPGYAEELAPALQDFAADPRFAPPAPTAGPSAARARSSASAQDASATANDALKAKHPRPASPTLPTGQPLPADPPTLARVTVGRELAVDALDAFGTFVRPELASIPHVEEAEDEGARDVTTFEALLRRYGEDFDDDDNRIALEMMAEKLDRWSEIVVAAKRHLARLTGTSGEDRIWAHLSIWNERARGERSGAPHSAPLAATPAPGGEPDLFGIFAGRTFEPPPIGSEGLFHWTPPADEESAEELSADDLEGADSEREPESIEIIDDEPVSSDEAELIADGDELEDVAGPTTEAEPSGPRDLEPQSAAAPAASERMFARSDVARDSRTLFSPVAPVPTATERELPLDADDLLDDDGSAVAPRAGSDADIGARGDARRAAENAIARDLRLGRQTATKTAMNPRPAPAMREAPPAKPQAIDPSVLRSGEFEAALGRASSDEERARILLERGRRELKQGQQARAIDTYRDALTFDTQCREALEALEALYRETRNATRLIEILEQKLDLAKTDPQRVDVLVSLAEIYEKDRGDTVGALERLEAAHALQPRNAAPIVAMARVHEAAGDFALVVADLRKLLRGEASRSEKLELLLKIAALEEQKLDDPVAAVETFEQIVDAHPQYKGAFDDLARLAEKSGSWKARAKLLEHQVELSKEPRKQAQLLVELGDLLAQAERDPKAAKKHYERAAKVFPSLSSSWRGLEQLAIWANEPERAEFFLEQRVRHTSDLAERACVLIELAQYRAVALNKHDESLTAFELAHKADPTNAVAASALLSHFVAGKRFADAAVLCDVLYRAATKADDRPRMLEILDTSWDVATAMGNRGQLLAVAAARFRLASDDTEVRRLFLETASAARDNDEALRRVRPALELALDRTGNDLAALSVLGELFRAAGDVALAENCFERVLLGNPVDAAALTFLSQRAEVRNDFRRAASLKERLAHELPDDGERFDLLLSAGDLWLRAKGQVATALRAYEEALDLRPRDQLLLRTLAGLYTDQEAWERVAPIQRALCEIEVEPDRKAKMLTSLAQLLEDRIGDATAATDALEEALELDATRLDAFERLVRLYTRQKDWIGLSTAYRQMLGRLDEAKDPKLAYALNHQLGLVYRDRIGDAERALKCFTQAATLRPDDLEARKIVTELLVVTERLDAAVEVARATLKKDPTDQQLYRDLYELFLRAHAYDKAWCVAEAMSVLGPLTDTERQFVEDYPPVDPSEIPASLLATAWPTHVHHADLDRTISSALQIAVSVYLRARLQQAAPPPLGTPLDQDPSPEAARVLQAFKNAAEVLACQMPALHGSPVPGPLFSTVLAIHPTLTISLATSQTVSNDTLNFLATKRLAEQQPALRARSLFPSVQELKQLFFTTTQLATTGPTSMMRPGWDGGLGAVMTPDERAALRGLVAGVATTGQKLDVKRWLQLAEVTAMRAGLLICGSVLTAQRAMGLEPRMPDDLPATQWLSELGMYAASEQYFELRETIHVAI